jgi:hypothetical protein
MVVYFLLNAESLVPQLAIWVFLSIVAWKLNSSERGLMTAVAIACGLLYALFPSGEDRYIAWACPHIRHSVRSRSIGPYEKTTHSWGWLFTPWRHDRMSAVLPPIHCRKKVSGLTTYIMQPA